MTITITSDFDLGENDFKEYNPFDLEYHDLLEYILECGEDRGDRTGTGTRSVFGATMRFDMRKGAFPLLTTKKVYWKGVVEELLWFLRGETNARSLQEKGVKIWDEWADEDGELGPVYGAQWRKWGQEIDSMGERFGGIDQIADIVRRIKETPECRRIILNAWNVSQLSEMALPPCHLMAQFYVSKGEYLDCQMYQRSADVFLGVPFNIASYALLTHMIAHVTGLKPGVFTHIFGDVHIYNNHFEQVKQQLARPPYDPPSIRLNPEVKNIDDFTFDDIELLDYDCHPAIKAEVSV